MSKSFLLSKFDYLVCLIKSHPNKTRQIFTPIKTQQKDKSNDCV